MFIETHTHLYDGRYDGDRKEMIQRAIDAGVAKLYMPNCDAETIAGMLQIEADFPGHCYSMMGLHPCYVKENYEQELAVIESWLQQRKFAAVGEIGLDYYWDKTFVAEQKIAFARQIDWALQYDIPIVIHSRESTQDCIDIVRQKQNGRLRGIFHCFSGTLEEAQQVADLGLYLGIGGVVTYKNNPLKEIVAKMPLSVMVLETDAPYLTPVPHRGKRNESSYIPLIAEAVADLQQCSLEQVGKITTENAEKIFG